MPRRGLTVAARVGVSGKPCRREKSIFPLNYAGPRTFDCGSILCRNGRQGGARSESLQVNLFTYLWVADDSLTVIESCHIRGDDAANQLLAVPTGD